MILFEKEYSSESLVDLAEDVDWALNHDCEIPVDEHGFMEGTFKVIIEWEND